MKDKTMKKESHLLRKTAAAVLAASFMFSIASCSKEEKTESSHSGKLIEEDMPWFETKTYLIDTGVDPDRKTQSIHSQLAGADEDNYIFLTQGNYEYPEDYDWEYESYLKLLISNIVVVNKNELYSTISCIFSCNSHILFARFINSSVTDFRNW